MRPLQFGVTEYDPGRAQPGWVLFAPAGGQDCMLLGPRGEIRHQWRLPDRLGNYGQIIENGNLLVTGNTNKGPKLAALGGHIMELDWDSNVVWEYVDPMQHHDFNPTPSGNILYLAFQLTPTDEAGYIRGGMPGSEHEDGGVYQDVLREVNRDGELVWEWRMADHFPYDKYALRDSHKRHEFAHANACHVQADGNILVSFRELDLLILVDRQTGEIIWEMEDRSWGGQHDPQRLENGNITLFANGSEQPTPEHSRILEIEPDSGEVVWTYKGDPPPTFFSARISSAQRLANGNTFICEGHQGRLFEVTSDGDIVWEYVSPFYKMGQEGRSNRIFRARKYANDDPRLADKGLAAR